MANDLLSRSAVELRRLIGARQLSPLELMDACIARIEALNLHVNAICATDFDRARAAARAAEAAVMRGDALGALHGLPLGVKDLQDTEGLLTTYGNVGFRSHVPSRDNSLVARLRAAGAIVTAKTNVPDMGAGANTRNPVWGATGNPFDPALNAGGSSGGSAAALACDMLPLATGSDTGGSLRIPAALCGVVGLRPSPGLVANDARPLGWSVISVLGPMGRSVADTALMLQACSGLAAQDPLSYTPTEASWPLPPADLASLRIGYTEDFGTCPVDPVVRDAFRARVEALRPLVAACEPVSLDLREADRVFDILRAESFLAACGDTWRHAPDTLGPNVRANVEMAASITLADRA
ncbi:MAG: amidase, partial [Propionibacteriaceae bacterium]|nr:amidase [Propionibacteriaceae bacterium]